jgi:hypothetical protein
VAGHPVENPSFHRILRYVKLVEVPGSNAWYVENRQEQMDGTRLPVAQKLGLPNGSLNYSLMLDGAAKARFRSHGRRNTVERLYRGI